MKSYRFLMLGIFACLMPFSAQGQFLRPKLQFKNDMMFSVGVAAGRETFIGLPKFGAYKQFPIRYTKRKGPQTGFRQPAIYAGVDGSVFVLFAGAFSVGPTIGYGHGPFSLDNSLTVTWLTSPEGVTEKNWTYNPKIGINVGPIWIKAGPSFPLSAETSWGNWMKMGDTYMNFELSYLVR